MFEDAVVVLPGLFQGRLLVVWCFENGFASCGAGWGLPKKVVFWYGISVNQCVPSALHKYCTVRRPSAVCCLFMADFPPFKSRLLSDVVPIFVTIPLIVVQ